MKHRRHRRQQTNQTLRNGGMDGGNVDWLPGMTPIYGEEGYGPNLNGNCRDSAGPWDIYKGGIGAVPHAVAGHTVFGADCTPGERKYYLGHHASAFSGLRKGEHYFGILFSYPTAGTRGTLSVRQPGGTSAAYDLTTTGEWGVIDFSFEVESGATEIRLELKSRTNGGVGMVYFDHFELYQLDNCQQSKADISIAHSMGVRTSRAIGVF